MTQHGKCNCLSNRPTIEEFLGDMTGPARSILLFELIALEVEYRCRQGEVPQPEEYGRRFSALDPQEIARVLGARSPTEENPSSARADRAMATLRQAVQNGYKDAARLRQDKNLDPLRSRGDFQKLLAALEAKGKANGD